TVEGVGEWSTTTLGHGRGNQIELLQELKFPHSLGLLYSAFTSYLGFRVNSGEYKVMGLAPYGEPRYAELIRSHLIDCKADGSFHLDMDYFDYGHSLRMTGRKFERLFGGPPRVPESPLDQRHKDLAASIQTVTNEVMVGLAQSALERTGSDHLVLAGGVALNCVANSCILRQTRVEDMWIQPAAGDAGGALGAALFVWHQLLQRPRTPSAADAQQGSLLGPSFDDATIRQALESEVLQRHGAVLHDFVPDTDSCDQSHSKRGDSEEKMLRAVAAHLDAQRVVGWFQGRMEFGPRALGARSILADPRDPNMQTRLNEKIKFREAFRPFAPSVLSECAADVFRLPKVSESPYMLLTADILPREPPAATGGEQVACQGEPRSVRSSLPAVTHVDGSARVQTVDVQRHPRFHRLLACWKERTGCPVLVNTSFNVRGEPPVCTPADALRTFFSTGMDVLAIGNFVLVKSPQAAAASARAHHPFALD
ncbi:MAG: carbamoyltransferase family protein, partial [Aureliella sp.]